MWVAQNYLTKYCVCHSLGVNSMWKMRLGYSLSAHHRTETHTTKYRLDYLA